MIDEKKLIAEIEGYKSAAEHFLKYKDNLEHWRTQRDLCDKLLSFINSMQEKPKFKIGDIIKGKYIDDEYEITDIDDKFYKCHGTFIPIIEQDLWKLTEEQDTKLPCIHQKDTLDEYAYQVAYDLSNDWVKETPDWDDVETACKLGANWMYNFNNKKDE